MDGSTLHLGSRVNGSTLHLGSIVNGCVLHLGSRVDGRTLHLESRVNGSTLQLESMVVKKFHLPYFIIEGYILKCQGQAVLLKTIRVFKSYRVTQANNHKK